MRYAVAHGRRRRGPAGRGARTGEQAVAALRAAGHDVTEVVAGSLEQALVASAALVAEGVDVLVVVGGDGMVSMAADLCAGSPTAVAILPAGTGNDNARSLGSAAEHTRSRCCSPTSGGPSTPCTCPSWTGTCCPR